ncbi:hypothetical protein IWW37_001249 [Coemansia sp. RSA 2050]|nr:hypothetical protein IWW37_001249 [Coemansia sp. RSA 2050]KAJ2736878.1 hypothetical protein IW152_000389 [Coemansia sp. BCRC 34962]
MAAHAQYVPANLAFAYATAPQQRQSAAQGPVAPAPMAYSFERKPVAKRGRASDLDSVSADAMDVCGRGEQQQQCVYYRKSMTFVSPKRAKTVVETHV